MNRQAEELIKFIDNSPTAFHAAAELKKQLKKAGFKELNAAHKWDLKKGEKYFVSRNDSALIAFVTGKDFLNQGLRIISSHTDSPGLKVKPDPVINSDGQYVLNTEIYGGPILNTWYDRDLSLAGKIVLKSENSFELKERLIDLNKNLAVIPNLPIHLNKDVNQKGEIDQKKGLRALLTQDLEKNNVKSNSKTDLTIKDLIAQVSDFSAAEILETELYLYPTQKAHFLGPNQEYIAAGRQDNLAMVHASLKALLMSKVEDWTQMAIFYDNEEIGSHTPQGADSPFAGDLIERIIYNLGADREDYYRIIEKSFLISADMAHAVHPNFSEEYDQNNRPLLNQGPVIKYNANLKYTTNAGTAGVLIDLMQKNNISYQIYSNRTDKRGGSTIGPIAATQLGIKSIDLGNPLLAMHSSRELGGSSDQKEMIKLMNLFFQQK
ncbi:MULTISPECIES: M18 family aminopeptidase [Halanaerobium]|jgi:aspartyl aminopeptidase|uniref:M18 family aminopeptidase n=1 Tax=Halanaerobium kushneri TaxID=56779 RepID=A0A1N6PV63_9FIRM|nr:MULTISPECIES: M18 family aminopeptidase [Halanaerobium]RCW55677.1 aspartyl aminopeptidase [Halanaerobium sp. ST460_2HS_T2]SIQ08182.1 aspartyl aminopeptidase [Halanaerobium kushneri]